LLVIRDFLKEARLNTSKNVIVKNILKNVIAGSILKNVVARSPQATKQSNYQGQIAAPFGLAMTRAPASWEAGALY
jgi:hypothetical protein